MGGKEEIRKNVLERYLTKIISRKQASLALKLSERQITHLSLQLKSFGERGS